MMKRVKIGEIWAGNTSVSCRAYVVEDTGRSDFLLLPKG